MTKTSCPYAVLGVTPDAPEPSQRRAYRQLARRHHPDMGGNPAEFLRVQQAWDQVRDAGFRLDHQQRGSCPCSRVAGASAGATGAARTEHPGPSGPAAPASQSAPFGRGTAAGTATYTPPRSGNVGTLQGGDVAILAGAAVISLSVHMLPLAIAELVMCAVVAVMILTGHTQGPRAAVAKAVGILVVLPAVAVVLLFVAAVVVGIAVLALVIALVVCVLAWS